MGKELVLRADSALIENTNFEKFLQRIEKEKQREQKVKGIDKTRCALIFSIFSVYNFLLHKVGMPHGKLSVAEFEAAEAELKNSP